MEFAPEFIQRLKKASKIVFSTGAGVSAESGVPTFRGKDGIWNKLSPQELASVNGFMANPSLVWEWYQYRRQIMSTVKPNPGHDAIVEFQRRYPEAVLITQNVDNLHRRAGSEHVLELHGNISRNKCFSCGEPFLEEINPEEEMPRCHCGGLIRPDVVWFGEMLPEQIIRRAYEASETAEIFFAVGTSAIVHPAASLPLIARRAGAYLVEVNIEETAITPGVDQFLQGPSGVVLPALLAELDR